MAVPVVPFSFLSGRETLGVDTDGWSLDNPEDGFARTVRTRVLFNRAFSATPLVHLGLSGFDIGNNDSARLHTHVEELDAQGFDIVVSTWLYTRVWKVEVSWLAVGS
jgi:hypothetical protein